MKSAPVLRGGPFARGVWLVSGLLLCAIGILCFLEAKLGLAPWDVLHQGLAKHTPLSFGLANEVVGVVVMGIGWRLGARIGIGTVANAVLIGGFIALIQGLRSAEAVRRSAACRPDRDARPRAGVLRRRNRPLHRRGSRRRPTRLADARRFATDWGFASALARGGLELLVLVAGFVLGGKVGVGTLVFALGIGPSVELAFLGSPAFADRRSRVATAAACGIAGKLNSWEPTAWSPSTPPL